MSAAESVIESRARDSAVIACIEQIAHGDQHALTTLYDSTSRLVFGLVVRILNEASVAEEVMLDVYMQVWRQAKRYSRERGTPLAWLMTIARSRAIDRLRAGRNEKERNEPLDPAAQYSAGTHVEEAALAAEKRRIVRSALDALPLEQREAIDLAFFGGLTHTEIAEHLGHPLGTVKTRVRLGMMKLREILNPALMGEL